MLSFKPLNSRGWDLNLITSMLSLFGLGQVVRLDLHLCEMSISAFMPESKPDCLE